MNKFNNFLVKFQKQNKLTETYLYFALFSLPIFLYLLITLPLINSLLIKNRYIIKSHAAVPPISSITQTTFNDNSKSRPVNMPSTVITGDLLLVLFTNDGSASVTTPAGWNRLYSQSNGSALRGSAYPKISQGTESGTTVNFRTSSNEQAAAQVYRIANWSGSLDGVNVVQDGTITSGSTVDMPALTPSWGQAEPLWIPVIHTSTGQTVTSGPANYTNLVQTSSGTSTSAAQVITSQRTFDTATEDPGVYTMSGSGASEVYNTIAINLGIVSEPTPTASPTPTGPEVTATPTPGPITRRLVIVGGHLASDNMEVYDSIATSITTSEKLCTLSTASNNPTSDLQAEVNSWVPLLGQSRVVGVNLSTQNPSEADSPSIASQLAGCRAYWFIGGSQLRIVDVFRPDGRNTAAYNAMWENYINGALVAGSSAGAAMMPDPMIRTGNSNDALRNGLSGVPVSLGMGYFPYGFTDQHFFARGRWGRLVVAVVEHPAFDIGFGIDENTAIAVSGNNGNVIGESGVLIVDARTATGSRTGGNLTGVVLNLTGKGDSIDLSSLTVTRPSHKSTPSGMSNVVMPSDPFADWAFLKLMNEFSRSSLTSVTMTSQGYTLKLDKGSGFSVKAYTSTGVQGTPSGLSAGPFILSILK